MPHGGADTVDPGSLNRSVWAQGGFLKSYSNRQLRPVEVLILARYRDDFSGRVLELGCGAGRLVGYLVSLARDAYGIDLSEDMLRYCRDRYPDGTFLQGDILDLSRFKDGSLDAVVASCNLFDIFSDADRHRALHETRRVLRDGGLFVMSSHNRAYLPHVRRPTELRTSDPLRFAFDLVRAPRRLWRHRQLVPLEREEAGYAIVSDGAHEYSLVHYFIAPDAQLGQLAQEGFEPLECLDLEGRPLGVGDTAPDCVELHYVARRS